MIEFVEEHTKANTFFIPQFGITKIVDQTYKTFTGANKQEALLFLNLLGADIIEPNEYYCVETPDGIWCRDIDGIYNENEEKANVIR